MTLSLARKISFLSKALKYICFIGIIIFPIFNLLYWVLDFSEIRFLATDNWYIQFWEKPNILDGNLSLKMRLIGFSIDLIPCMFFIAILAFLSKLFKQYERLYFFSKKNTRCIYWIASIMFFNVLISPFYLALRNYLFAPGGEYTVALFRPADFKAIIISFAILLFAYITEAAHHIEEDLVGIV